MAKWTIKLVRESYVEIDADNYEEASKIAHEEGLTENQIEEGADYWDIHEIKKSDEY